MNEYDNVFGNIMRAKPVSQFSPRLPRGQHQVLLKRYLPKASTNPLKPGTIIEADFLVGATNAPGLNAGEIRGWAWMIDAPGYRGPAEQGRAQAFILAVLEAVTDLPAPTTFRDPQGNPCWYEMDEQGRFTTNPPTPLQKHNSQSVGSLLAGGYFTGLTLVCEATPALKNGQQIRTQKGEDINNANFVVPPQTMQQIAQMRAQLDQIAAAAPPPPPAPAPQQAYAPQQPNHAPAAQYGGAPAPQYAPQPQTQGYNAPAPQPQAAPAPQGYAPQPQYAPAPAPQVQYAPQPAPAAAPLAPGPVAGAGPLGQLLANMRNNGQG